MMESTIGVKKSYWQDFAPQRLPAVLTVALISCLVVITYQVSYGSLIFSGDLLPYLSSGIGFCLMGVVLIGALEALFSGNPGMVAIPTITSAIIIATMGANISMDLQLQPENIFPTVTAAISITSLLTGFAFLTMGWLQLGNFIRYIPYPVIGGFLAGTGWLVVTGAMKTLNGIPLNIMNLPQFLTPDSLLRWLPGVIYAVVVLFVTRRFKHFLVMPAMILGGVIVFYSVLALFGVSNQEATISGWLYQPFSPGALWKPPPLQDFGTISWSAILHQAGSMGSLILISSITLLLYASGVEVTAGKEIDLNRELRACGIGNLAAALSASPPGYTIITMSVLSHRLKADSRMVGLAIAAICLVVMFFAGPLIALFPKLVLGGVLIYLGLTFLVDWVIVGWRKLSHSDYFIVIIILIVMGLSGLLPGLAIGITLAAGLFIVKYSQVPIIRRAYTGRSYHSRVERPQPHTDLLRRLGNSLVILELQGYAFFGTANHLYEYLKEKLQEKANQSLQAVILDFRRVSGVDASATLSFVRLKRLLKDHGIILVFVQLNPEIEARLNREVLTNDDRDWWRVFTDLDLSVEWFEEKILREETHKEISIQAQPGAVQAGQEQAGLALLFAALGSEAESMGEEAEEGLLRLMGYLERIELAAGENLVNPGDNPRSLFFLDSGELTMEYIDNEDQPMRLETSGPGMIVGEMSFYLGSPEFSTITARQPVTVYRLSLLDLQRIESQDPLVAIILHRFLLQRVARRLESLLETVVALNV